MRQAEAVMCNVVARAADREGKYLTLALAGATNGIGVLFVRSKELRQND